ncbi:MAG: DNA-binding protein [Clostridia bacterium]|nr:DNA-binding protein [Clostridia bacterium]MBR3553884.1 DNA-binding protein [Clostridia bacterium]
MTANVFGNTIAVRLDRGEEICASLSAVCARHGVTAGVITGLGAVKGTTVCLFDPEEKQYHDTVLTGFLELTNLTGNAGVKDGNVYLHLHATLADGAGHAFGGHLKTATVGATAELFITVLPGTLGRVHDDESGLNLWDI